MATEGFIGYSESGKNNLKNTIADEQEKLVSIINSFESDIVIPLKEAWKGDDANLFISKLVELIAETKENIISNYSNMSESFEKTYNSWVKKQNG